MNDPAIDALPYYRTLLDENWFPREGLCVTWCSGAVDEIVWALGSHRLGEDQSAISETLGRDDTPQLILLGKVRDRVVLTEPYGVVGSMPEILKRLSAIGRRAVNVHWNVEWDNSFSVAEDGEVVLSFDMLSPGDLHGARPARFREELAGFPSAHEPGDWMAGGLRLAEQLTGVRLPAQWFTTQRFMVLAVSALPIPDLPDAYRNHPVLRDTELQEVLRAPADHLATIARLLAEVGVRDTGLAGDQVDETLAWLRSRSDHAAGRRLRASMEALSRQMRQHAAQLRAGEGGESGPGSASHAVSRRAAAAETIADALHGDVRHAARQASFSASYIPRLSDDEAARVVILTNCVERVARQGFG